LVDGYVIVVDASTFENSTNIPDVKTYVWRDTKCGRFIFVSVDNKPRQEITSAAIATPFPSVVLTTTATAAPSIPTSFGFGFLNG
jgi:hypothetical protein